VLASAAQGAVDPPEGPFKPGDRLLGNYEILALLGRGGHAFVYDCYDSFLARQVAIKVIPNLPERGPKLTRRAREEAKMLCRLDHPNVVGVHGAGELDDGMVYIVMEKLGGLSLREVLGRLGQLSIAEALQVGAQIAQGVAAAHDLGVIHRDLKPENAFVESGNHVKVLDFGVAKFLGEGAETTESNLLHGTLLYMSPEHLQGFGVTFRSDVYALGTVLYEMIAGQHPCLIGLETVTADKLAWIQVAGVPPTLDRIVRGVPDDVVRMVRRATAKQAAQRYATMQEFADAIEAALDRFMGGARFERTVTRDLIMHARGAASAASDGTGQSGPAMPVADPPERPAGTDSPRPTSSATTAKMPHPAWLSDSVGTEPLPDAAPKLSMPRTTPESSLGPMARTRTARKIPQADRAAPLFSPYMLVGAVLLGFAAAIPIGIWLGVDRVSPAVARSASEEFAPSSARQAPPAELAVPSARPSDPPAGAQTGAEPSGKASAPGSKRILVPAGSTSAQTNRLRERATWFEQDLGTAGKSH
jgi:serine/threonine protein kinase